jgi:hypothetical protein
MRAALGAALLLGAAPAALLSLPAPAVAQAVDPKPDHPLWAKLLEGEFLSIRSGPGYTASGHQRVQSWANEPGQLYVQIRGKNAAGKEVVWHGPLRISGDMHSASGKVVIDAQNGGGGEVTVRVRPKANGGFMLEEVSGDLPFMNAPLEFGRGQDDRADTQETAERYADWLGAWDVGGWRLNLRAEGKRLEGDLSVPADGGRWRVVRRLLLSQAEQGKLVGAWQDPKLDAYNGGRVEMDLAADKRGFVGELWGAGRNTGFKGAKLEDGEWRPTITQGDIQPKPGYVSCNSWCRVKLEGHEIKEIADSSGQFRPIIFYTVSIHNISPSPKTISADRESSRQGTISLWTYEGQFSENKEYASTVGPVRPWDPTKLREMIYDRPVVLPPGAEVKLTYMLSPGGNHLPRNPDTLRLRTNEGDFSRAPEVRINNPADWLCPVYRREQEIFARGDTKRKPWTLPEICGGPNLAKIEDLQGRWIVNGAEAFEGAAQNRSVTLAKTPGTLPALQFTEQVAPYEYETVHRTAEAVWTGVTTLGPDLKTATFVSNDRKTVLKLAREGAGSQPPPAQPPVGVPPPTPVTGPTPAPPPQPAPPPAPIPAPPSAPAPVVQPSPAGSRALAQPGVFHALDDFDVRLDQVVPARDGAVNVFVTVKNKAGKEKYISTAAFLIVQLTDSEGVSVREGHMYRATAEGSESLPAGMTLPADGELKGRFTLTPPQVHGPLKTVSIRQSDKKAVWFDASGADANPSAFPAPVAGRGAFKPLSKFDLRIDNIAPARDGKLEAFITLRNPGRDWRYLSEGDIKLRGTDGDGAIGSTISEHYSVRGERGRYDELPAGFYLEPGAEARMRLIWERPVSGPIKATDGTVEQVFTAGG